MAQSVEYALVAAIASAIATFTMTELGETLQKEAALVGQSKIESLMDIAQRGGDPGGGGSGGAPGAVITLDPCAKTTTASR